MANFYGLSALFDWRSSLSRNVSELQSQKNANDVWLRERDLWLERKKWIDSKQPRIPANEVPQSVLQDSLTKSATAAGLQIQEQSFGETKTTPNYQSVSVRLKLTGSLQNVVKWLFQIQQPELFQAVTNFSLKSADAPPTVNLELEVARWYAPNA
jgi:hypothetical protein